MRFKKVFKVMLLLWTKNCLNTVKSSGEIGIAIKYVHFHNSAGDVASAVYLIAETKNPPWTSSTHISFQFGQFYDNLPCGTSTTLACCHWNCWYSHRWAFLQWEEDTLHPIHQKEFTECHKRSNQFYAYRLICYCLLISFHFSFNVIQVLLHFQIF